MKILAILALVATIAGAGAVLYGINTLAPQVVQTAANVTEAQSVADTFDDMVTRLENGTFGGRIFGGTDDLRAEDCAFVTYTVRMQNKGFSRRNGFPWSLVRAEGRRRAGSAG